MLGIDEIAAALQALPQGAGVSGPLEDVAALVLRESGMVIRASQLPALRGGDPPRRARDDPRAAPGRRGPARRCASRIVERLIDEVTIKETYFLRHRDELQAIDWKALAAQRA